MPKAELPRLCPRSVQIFAADPDHHHAAVRIGICGDVRNAAAHLVRRVDRWRDIDAVLPRRLGEYRGDAAASGAGALRHLIPPHSPRHGRARRGAAGRELVPADAQHVRAGGGKSTRAPLATPSLDPSSPAAQQMVMPAAMAVWNAWFTVWTPAAVQAP